MAYCNHNKAKMSHTSAIAVIKSQVYAAGWKKPERFVVKAADNITDLYGVMWKPSDFDPEKKYPIILGSISTLP